MPPPPPAGFRLPPPPWAHESSPNWVCPPCVCAVAFPETKHTAHEGSTIGDQPLIGGNEALPCKCIYTQVSAYLYKYLRVLLFLPL